MTRHSSTCAARWNAELLLPSSLSSVDRVFGQHAISSWPGAFIRKCITVWESCAPGGAATRLARSVKKLTPMVQRALHGSPTFSPVTVFNADTHPMGRSLAHIHYHRRGKTAKTLRRGSSTLVRPARVGNIQMLPCPFCGSRDPLLQEVDVERWAVCCVDCGTIGPHLSDDNQILGEMAIELWNMRNA
jgi:Restriction alleviation protein Lar